MCPSCGAMRGRCIQNGYDDKDRVLRQRECYVCGLRYATVEVAVPGASFYQLADSWHLRQVNWARLRRGFHNTRQGRYRRNRQRIEVQVNLIEPAKEAA